MQFPHPREPTTGDPLGCPIPPCASHARCGSPGQRTTMGFPFAPTKARGGALWHLLLLAPASLPKVRAGAGNSREQAVEGSAQLSPAAQAENAVLSLNS